MGSNQTSMPPRHGDARWFRPGLAVTALIGLSIRVAFIAYNTSRASLVGDAAYYHFQAKAVAHGQGFLQPYFTFARGHPVPGADHPPGFVVLLAFFDKIGLTSPNAQRYAIAVIGTVTIVLIGLLAKRLLGPRAGLIAAFIMAIYPQIWINDGMLMSETLYVAAIVCAIWCTYSIWRRPTTWGVVGAAAALTVACSARPESALLFAAMIVPVVLGRKVWTPARKFTMLSIAAAVPIIFMGPWVLYNHGRFAEPVYLSTGLGQTMVSMNCDLTYSGPTLGYYNNGCGTKAQGIPPASNDASITDKRFTVKAKQYILSHKREVPKVVLAREARIWGVWHVNQQIGFDGWLEGRGGIRVSRWAARSYWVVALLALAGLFAWRRAKLPLYPLMAQIGLTAFTAALTSGITRYRVGAEISLVLLAAAAIDLSIRTVSTRHAAKQPDNVEAKIVDADAPPMTAG